MPPRREIPDIWGVSVGTLEMEGKESGEGVKKRGGGGGESKDGKSRVERGDEKDESGETYRCYGFVRLDDISEFQRRDASDNDHRSLTMTMSLPQQEQPNGGGVS